MNRLAIVAVAIGIAICAPGCATVATRHPKCGMAETRPALYPATLADVWIMVGNDPLSAGASKRAPTMLFFFAGLIDLPFSLLTDTVCLPYDLWRLATSDDKPQK